MLTRLQVGAFTVCLASLQAGTAVGQQYPTKPIRLLTSEAGGAGDVVSRLMAPGLSKSLGEQIVVDNRGNASAEIVAKAVPDGYTLLVNGPIVWLSPFMRDHVPWDPVKDFSIITLPVSAPSVLVVHPTTPVKTVAELIALAKAKPGALTYGSAQPGSSSHIAAELLKSMAGIDLLRVPYKGNGPALNALLGAQVQLMFAPAGSATPQIKAGRVRAVAITSPEPSELLPGLPTVAATLPGYASEAILGMFARAGTPAAIVNRLNQEVARALNQPEVKERLFSLGTVVLARPQQQAAAMLKAEMVKWGKVIKDAGIRDE